MILASDGEIHAAWLAYEHTVNTICIFAAFDTTAAIYLEAAFKAGYRVATDKAHIENAG